VSLHRAPGYPRRCATRRGERSPTLRGRRYHRLLTWVSICDDLRSAAAASGAVPGSQRSFALEPRGASTTLIAEGQDRRDRRRLSTPALRDRGWIDSSSASRWKERRAPVRGVVTPRSVKTSPCFITAAIAADGALFQLGCGGPLGPRWYGGSRRDPTRHRSSRPARRFFSAVAAIRATAVSADGNGDSLDPSTAETVRDGAHPAWLAAQIYALAPRRGGLRARSALAWFESGAAFTRLPWRAAKQGERRRGVARGRDARAQGAPPTISPRALTHARALHVPARASASKGRGAIPSRRSRATPVLRRRVLILDGLIEPAPPGGDGFMARFATPVLGTLEGSGGFAARSWRWTRPGP
jgi:hypothetical protein